MRIFFGFLVFFLNGASYGADYQLYWKDYDSPTSGFFGKIDDSFAENVSDLVMVSSTQNGSGGLRIFKGTRKEIYTDSQSKVLVLKDSSSLPYVVSEGIDSDGAVLHQGGYAAPLYDEKSRYLTSAQLDQNLIIQLTMPFQPQSGFSTQFELLTLEGKRVLSFANQGIYRRTRPLAGDFESPIQMSALSPTEVLIADPTCTFFPGSYVQFDIQTQKETVLNTLCMDSYSVFTPWEVVNVQFLRNDYSVLYWIQTVGSEEFLFLQRYNRLGQPDVDFGSNGVAVIPTSTLFSRSQLSTEEVWKEVYSKIHISGASDGGLFVSVRYPAFHNEDECLNIISEEYVDSVLRLSLDGKLSLSFGDFNGISNVVTDSLACSAQIVPSHLGNGQGDLSAVEELKDGQLFISKVVTKKGGVNGASACLFLLTPQGELSTKFGGVSYQDVNDQHGEVQSNDYLGAIEYRLSWSKNSVTPVGYEIIRFDQFDHHRSPKLLFLNHQKLLLSTTGLTVGTIADFHNLFRFQY